MVARINTGKSIAKALNYNEQKVQLGKAELLDASGFIKDAGVLNFYDKMEQFERHISLNERATTNGLHVSLNFSPDEKISNEKMTAIAQSYMDRIGFGNQPYLVYRHHDAGHPHIHIVSTNIRNDGSRISMHNLGRNESEKARKEIEIDFGLVKAGDKSREDALKLVPVNAQKINYGRSETKRAIANVLMAVINQYKYVSLPELNAVLKLYNVSAERGSEESRMFQHKGLVYRVLDEKGNKVGTPIKASAFYIKPTLASLEKKFIENEPLKAPFSKRLQASIGWIMNKEPAGINAFVKALEKENISAVLRKGKEDVIYGITYVDHKTKCVFNGSDLGKAYSAKAILEKCNPAVSLNPLYPAQQQLKEKESGLLQKHGNSHELYQEFKSGKLLETVASATPSSEYVPYELKKKKKKKKKRLFI